MKYEPDFRLALGFKDIGLALALLSVEEAGLPLDYR
jgi:3-hydroxyisobutyrate dehydrogenase-like beta-hydroxyacid dehydrogenase